MVDEDRVHYHHIAGMGGGYMPDDWGVYDTFESAVSSVEDDIAHDTENDGDHPVRTFERYSFDPERGHATIAGFYPEDVSPHDLGWVYEVFPAFDASPDHEDCRAILNGEKEAPTW